MENINSKYIALHFDRLNQELLDGYGREVGKKSQEKKQQSILHSEKNRSEDHHDV